MYLFLKLNVIFTALFFVWFQSAIRSYVKDACSKLPTEEKDVCNSFVKDYSEDLFRRLIKDLVSFRMYHRNKSQNNANDKTFLFFFKNQLDEMFIL